MDLNKNIIIYSLFYPYGDFDNYFNDEIKELSKKFNKVYVICTDGKQTIYKAKRKTPKNVITFRFCPEIDFFDKILSIKFLFNKLFYSELLESIKGNGKIRIKLMNQILRTLFISSQYKIFTSNLIAEHNLLSTELYLYTYWLMEPTLCICKLKKEHSNIKAFSRAHSSDFYLERSPTGFWPFRKYFANNLDSIYFISQYGANYFSKKHKSLSFQYKLKNSYLGVKNNFELIKIEEPILQIHIVSNGWIQPLKRFDLIAKAIVSVENIEIKWSHIGGGEVKNEYFIEFQKNINILFKKNNKIKVDLLGGLTINEVFSFLENNHIDLLISTSTTEGIPVSIMEAMSFGIPCIATAVGGTPEIVNNENGYLLPETPTPKEVADKIEQYYNLSIKEKNKKREAAYNTWKNEYNAEKNYTTFVNSILKL